MIQAPTVGRAEPRRLTRSMDRLAMSTRLTLLLSREEVATAVERLAGELDRDYARTSPVLVGVLKGVFVFMADLVRYMKTSIRSTEFVRLSSYGSSTVSSGRARVLPGLPQQAIRGQDVVLVEDIVDTGTTVTAALRYLERRKPASLRVCALLDKPARRQVPVTIDYLGFTIPDRFVVGYGLDVDGRYRQLPAIYTLDE